MLMQNPFSPEIQEKDERKGDRLLLNTADRFHLSAQPPTELPFSIPAEKLSFWCFFADMTVSFVEKQRGRGSCSLTTNYASRFAPGLIALDS
jgi:hypothetical protein